MKAKYTKNLSLLFAALTFLFVAAIVFNACAPDNSTVDPPDEENAEGFATDRITHVHIKGTDPCPQDIQATALVYSYKSAEFTEREADSVVITNPSRGLTAKFESTGTMSDTLENNAIPTAIEFTFTCDIAQSFTHTYKLLFYKDGVLVAEEDLEVVVTVK